MLKEEIIKNFNKKLDDNNNEEIEKLLASD